jgi:hypothetical protein
MDRHRRLLLLLHLQFVHLFFRSDFRSNCLFFISVTDPRFPGIVENPMGIVGVSNPIAHQMRVRVQNVFTVGFAAARGLGRGRRPWRAFEATAMQTSDLRGLLFQNTTRVIAAVKDAIADRPRVGETKVRIMSDVLEKRIADRQSNSGFP